MPDPATNAPCPPRPAWLGFSSRTESATSPVDYRDEPTDHAGVETGVGMNELLSDLVEPGGHKARRSLDQWMARRNRGPSFEDVHAFVIDHSHSVLHGMSVSDVESATIWPTRRGETDPRHALGDLRKGVDCMAEVDNWPTPPWAFNYVFHDLMERMGRMPTWPDVEAHLRGAARNRILEPFALDFGFTSLSAADRVRYCRALRWRLATAYYSFSREVDLIVRLRRLHDLPVRYHILADAQFKIDLWCGRVIVSLLIRNPKYRDSGIGRKRRASDMLDGSAFEALSVELAVPDAFGRPSLVPAAEIASMADLIKSAMSRTEGAGSA